MKGKEKMSDVQTRAKKDNPGGGMENRLERVEKHVKEMQEEFDAVKKEFRELKRDLKDKQEPKPDEAGGQG
jgi:chaperonin cofactor prefoldin